MAGLRRISRLALVLLILAFLPRTASERPRAGSSAPSVEAPSTSPAAAAEAPCVPGGVGTSPAWNRPLPPHLEAKLVSLRDGDALRERDGALHFNARQYGASVDGRRAEWALYPKADDPRPRPRWSFELQSVDVGGLLWARGGDGKARRGGDGRSASIARGPVEERYVFLEDAMEQLFVVSELPARRGDIRVTGRVASSLDGPPDGTRGPSLSFRRDGEEVLAVREAVVVDAAGETLALDLEYDRGEMAMTVPADWVARATLPITIDPLIGSPITLDTDGRLSFWIKAAYNTSTQQWFVVWNEMLGSRDDDNIVGRTVDAQGATGPLLNLAADPGLAEYFPEISYSPSLNRFCLLYGARTAYTEALLRMMQARMLNGDGTPVSGMPILTVSSRPYDSYNGYGRPNIAWDGTRWFATWRYRANNLGDLEGRFIASNGSMTAVTANLDGGSGDAGQPLIAFTGGNYAVAWSEGNGSSALSFARTISTAGALGPRVSLAAPHGIDLISGGGGRFLVLFHSTQAPVTAFHGVAGILMTNTLSPVAGPFVVTEDSLQVTPSDATWSAFSNCWMALAKRQDFMAGQSDVRAYRIDPDGRAHPGLLLGSRLNQYNGETICATSGTNVVLAALIEPQNASGTPVVAQRLTTDAPPPPPPPAGLTAVAGDSRVQLSWTAVAGATEYFILRGENGGTPVYIGSVPTPGYLDFEVYNGSTYQYAVSASGDSGQSGYAGPVSATPAPPNAVHALFVVGNTTLGTGDAAVRTRLQALGYTTAVKGASAATTADANGKAVVVVSSTVTASAVGTKFQSVAVPVVVWENVQYDSDYMRLTGTTAGTHYGTATGQTQVNIVDASHPLAGGLAAGARTVSAPGPYTWGKPQLSAGSQAIVAAQLTTGDTSRAAVFGYEKGASMVGQTAPARRVGLFLGDTTAASLTGDGWKLFEAAIRWAAGVPSAPWNVVLTSNNGSITLDWEPSAGATSYVILRATSASGPFTTVATGVTGTSYTSAGLTNGTTYYFQVCAVNAGGQSAPAATASGKPQASPIHVAIKGRRYLRTFPNGGTDPDLWSEGSYEAVVRRIVRKTVNGVSQDVAEPVAFTSAWTSLADPMATPGCIQVLDPASNPCRLRATTTSGVAVIRFTATVGTASVSTRFSVGVDERYHPAVIFRFPEETNAANRTQRVPAGYTNADLWAGNEGDTDMAARDRRAGARYKLVSQWFMPLEQIFKQACIQPYFLVESARGLKFDVGFVNGEFVPDEPWQHGTQTFYPPSPAFRTVAGKNLGSYINIYLVSKLRSRKSGVLEGVNIPSLNISKRGLTILIADNADHATIAHEMGHALTLDHVTLTSGLHSTLNNLTGVILDAPPDTTRTARRHLMMWEDSLWLGTLITSDEADKVRFQMDLTTGDVLNFWKD